MRAATRGLFRAFAQARSLGACPSSARRPPSVVTEWKFTSEMTSHLRCPISTRRPRRRRSPPEHRRPRTRRARCNSSRPPLHREILQHFAEGPRRRAPPAQHRHKDCPREGRGHRRALRQVPHRPEPRNPPPRARRGPDRVRVAPEGGGHTRREPDRGDKGQRRHHDRRRPLPTRGGPGQGVVRRGEPDLRRLAARADHDAQRDWQDLPRQDVRGEGPPQPPHRQHDQRSRHRLGPRVPSLRDPRHRPAHGHQGGHGDAGRSGTSQEGDGAGVRG